MRNLLARFFAGSKASPPVDLGLCLKCRGLNIVEALKRAHNTPGDALLEHGENPDVIGGWYELGRDVFGSASSCQLCALVCQGWRRWRRELVRKAILNDDFDPSDPPEDLNDDVGHMVVYTKGKVSFEFIRRRRYSPKGEEWNYILAVKCSKDGPRGSFDVHDPLMAAFRITSDANQTSSDELSNLGVGVTICEDPMSTHSLNIAKEWLDTCKLNHERCRVKFGEANMPTRFLDVGDDPSGDTIFLRESPNVEDRRYVALSHCWGTSLPLRLMSTNAAEIRENGISISTLPKTFRDSVTVVRTLGVRYVWIDSICIIQDDAEDWRREAGRMAGVYRNAHFVLSADRATSDENGFLSMRQKSDQVSFAPLVENNPFTLKLLPLGIHDEEPGLDANIFTNEPLSRRAWCLQERYLARRNLHYGMEQMIWECAELRTSEDGDFAPAFEDQLGRMRWSATLSTTVFNSRQRDDEDGVEHIPDYRHKEWYAMIEDYTSRAITKDPDRIAALLGLRVALESHVDDQYLVGIWRQGLLEGLVWQTVSTDKPLSRPTDLIVPSWTWASVKGPVRFPIYSWYDDRARWKMTSTFEPLAEYVSHSDSLNDDAGSTPDLRIAAPVVPVHNFKSRPKKAPESGAIMGAPPERCSVADRTFCFNVSDKAGEAREFWIDGAFDVKKEGDAIDKKNLYIIFLTRLPFIFEDFEFLEHRFGLLVVKEGDGDRYRRVGFVDGCLVSKGAVAAFPRVEGDYYVEDVNRLGPDPLEMGRGDVTLV